MTFALTGARVHVGDGLQEDLAVLVDGPTIAAIVPTAEIPADATRLELDRGILAAGFVDTQVNGGGGVLFNEAPTVAALRTIGEAHGRFGTTGFLPTVITDEIGVIDRAMRAVEAAIEQGVPGILGIHIEGPMLAPSRHGIHDPAQIKTAVPEVLELVCSLRAGRTLVTVAPEVVGPETIAKLARAGVIVAAGHTEATYEQMQAGFTAGVRGVTHLFNAMSQMINRAPGAVGAALDNQDVWCGVIVDGIHVHPATLRVAMRSRPVHRFMLVTDAMPPVGTEAASFQLQGRRIAVTGDRCVDANGTLAGSSLTMDAAVRNLIDLVGFAPAIALKLASATPAAFIGMADTRGTIAPARAADLVWLRDDLTIGATWIGGRQGQGRDAA